MKKFLIICIVLLIILTLLQLIYYKVNPKETNVSSLDSVDEDIEEERTKLYILGMSALYDNYNPKISFRDLQSKFYDFIIDDIPEIYKNINGKNVEEIKQYYEQNTETINNMDIYNEDDFVMIAHQINIVANGNNKIIDLYNYNVDTNTISKSENGLITFKVNLIYDNEKQIQILYTISEENDTVKISSATGLDEVFKTYTGKVSKKEVLNKIDTFISNIKDIRLNSTLKTENERRQYFELNKEELEKLGITSQDDYVGIAIQINKMRWRESDLKFEKYEVLSENIINEENYLSFELMIYYKYDSSLHLKVSLRNGESVTPDIKISSYANE